ncbi:secreted RxLR effector peptide protein, putative [Phytophthora infestans T30-4]|uniref:Secreted RxLR effector peptide protein n=2 Tax=Phytophthora infestans TaxID=4787 RepID=A0A833TJN7_PHYIN
MRLSCVLMAVTSTAAFAEGAFAVGPSLLSPSKANSPGNAPSIIDDNRFLRGFDDFFGDKGDRDHHDFGGPPRNFPSHGATKP